MRRVPADGEEHARSWLAWPADAPAGSDLARACAALVRTIDRFETVHVVALPRDASHVRRQLPSSVTVHGAADAHRIGELEAVVSPDGVEIIAWGGPEPGRRTGWRRAPDVASLIVGTTGLPFAVSSLPLGRVPADGWGTVLVALDRLPAIEDAATGEDGAEARDLAQVELAERLGALQVLWVPRRLGGGGPVVRFARRGMVLVHDQTATGHPDHDAGRQVLGVLDDARDRLGRRIQVMRVPAPAALRDADGSWSHASYLDHLVLDGAVLVPAFDDPCDGEVLELYTELFPGREVVAVESRPLARRGLGAHRMVWSQPASRSLTAQRGERVGARSARG